MCVFMCNVCVSEPKCTSAAHLPGPGGFLGHAPAVYREHQPEVRWTPSTQSQQLESSDPTGNSGADTRGKKHHLISVLFWNALLTRMLSAVITVYFKNDSQLSFVVACCTLSRCLPDVTTCVCVLSCCRQWAAFEKPLYLPCTVGACPSPMVTFTSRYGHRCALLPHTKNGCHCEP